MPQRVLTGARPGGSRVAAVALALAALAACTPAQPRAEDTTVPATAVDTAPPASPSNPAGGSLRVALLTDPTAIDPRFVADEEGTLVVDALFDSLVALDDSFRAVPAAAASWHVEDVDGVTRLTFALRPDATFHDGTPVTAADFVRTFNRIADGSADPPSFLAYLLAPVAGFDQAQTAGAPLAGLEALDPHTLRITLDRRFPAFVDVLAHPSLAPVPSAAQDVAAFADSPVGNGPFAMSAPWQRGEFIRVARYGGHVPEPARLEEVVFQVYADDGSQWSDLQAGRVHVGEVPVDQLAAAAEQFGRSEDGYTGPGLLDGVTATIYYLGFNTQQGPLADRRVRQALSLLVDREAIADDLLFGTRLPADALVPPPIRGYQTGACTYCVYDPEAARALVAEFVDGWTADEPPFAQPLTLVHNTGATHRRIADRVARDIEAALGEFGVTVEVTSEDLQPFVQRLRGGEMDVFRHGWQADYPGMGSYLYPMFHSAGIGVDNLSRYDVAEVSQLLDQARAESHSPTRVDLYQRAEDMILEDMPVAPVLFYRHSMLVRPEVRDLRIDALGRMDLTRVWLATAS